MKPKLAVFHNLPSGGAKRVLFENLKGLKEFFDFYLFDFKGPYDNFLNVRPLVKELTTHEFKETPLLPKPFGFLNSYARIYDLYRLNKLHKKIAFLIDEQKFDLILLFADRFSQTPFLLKHLKTRSLYYAHDPYIRSIYEPWIERHRKKEGLKENLKKLFYWPGEKTYKIILAWQDKLNTQKASKIIICSDYAGKLMKDKYKVNPETVHPGVDTGSFRPLQVKKEKAVISQGSLLFRKGHQFIIEALGKIETNNRPELFILADSGRDDEEMIISKLGLEHKVKLRIFKGVNKESEVVKIYNQALICVCGQISEPFPLSVLEAGACGLPIVSVAEGGMKESIIEGKNGFLTPRNPETFAKKVDYLLKDENLRITMGKTARRQIEDNYQWYNCNEKIKKVIIKMIKC